ncbi:thioredoxin-like protein, partial [Linderina pennispora]
KVHQLIKRNRVMVFSKTTCPYSRKAKMLLGEYRDQHGLVLILESDITAVKAALLSVSGRNTFPNIFVDGKSIGGSDELYDQHAKGELEELLRRKSLIV